MLLGTGNSNIEQTTLLFQFPDRNCSKRTREDILLQTYYENSSKLQTLCRMNRHERNSRFILLSLTVRIRQQRHVLQIISKIGFIHPSLLLASSHEGLHTTQKLLQVFLASQVIGILARHDILADSTLPDDGITQFIDIQGMRTVDERRDKQAEFLKFRLRTLVDIQSVMFHITYHLPETHLIQMGTIGNLHHGSSTDATSRIIDDTLESLLIVRVGNEAEIGDDILDFLTLIETQSTINTIWNALLSEFLLEASALGIGTIENGKLIVSAIILPLDALDILRHNQRLLLVAVGRLILNLLSFIIFAEHLFLNLIAVMMNQTVGSLHDGLSRSVVLFQFKKLGSRQLLLIIQYIIDVGTTEAIDALRIITHGTDTHFFLTELHHDRHLHMVGILILIHQDIIEPAGILLSDFLVISEKLESKHQEIIKVHRIRLTATLHVCHINLSDGRHLGTLVLLQDGRVAIVGFGSYQVVLRHRNPGMNSSRLIGLVIQSHLLDDCLQQ